MPVQRNILWRRRRTKFEAGAERRGASATSVADLGPFPHANACLAWVRRDVLLHSLEKAAAEIAAAVAAAAAAGVAEAATRRRRARRS